MNEVITRAEQLPPQQIPAEPTIGQLMQYAMQHGGAEGVATLKELVQLRIMVEERDARKAYFDALAKFQRICPAIVHDKKADIVSKRSGARFGYTYATLPKLTKHIAPYLEQCDLSYTWDTEFDGKVFKVVCRTRHIDGHSESSSFPVPIDGNERMSAAQANGAAMTYGMRRTLIAAFGLTTAETDIDGATGSQVDVEPITEKQAADISDMIEERWRDKDARERNRARFLRLMEVEKIADIPADKYRDAVDLLQRRGDA